ncbi:protein EFR3 homolog cmp44E-like [Artemia franciscana]|uniref:protein EFR3 homolog cmp44E-like n=1 Tax=Artemia franciscana TaxID=6661 RepID=UPI0032DA304F
MPFHYCYRCCAAFRPRYKRLVDNIYPVNPEDGLIRANLDKLIFYSCSSPEKLDRIGEYLAQRVNRDIYRRKYAFITLSMEAMDQLLASCHNRALNLYLESFLLTIEDLLQSDNPDLKILASQSFNRFANIEEDVPQYHRRYKFFVESFSQICHSSHNNPDVRTRLRLAGLKGIQGVIRKTCSEELADSIWIEDRMNLIMPSLLFNMQDVRPLGDRRTPDFDSESQQNDPSTIAESCLCEIFKRTPFNCEEILLKPLLAHLDNHSLWTPSDFAMYIFERIMCTVPVHLTYRVIAILMGHLEASRKKPAQIRIEINNVLTRAISIATGDGAGGPSVLMIVDGLLKQLQNFTSAKFKSVPEEDIAFKDGIITTLASFSKACPDFQKTDILTFIVERIPVEKENDKGLQRVLLEAVAKVAEHYKTVQLHSIFKNDLVAEKLTYGLLSPDIATRLLAHQVLHSLLDRHGNVDRVKKVSLILEDPSLNFASPGRSDIMFFRKYGKELLETCYSSMTLELNMKCIEFVYTTFALMILEISCEETAVDFVHCIISFQDLAISTTDMDAKMQSMIHSITICLLSLLSLSLKIEKLKTYTREVAAIRNRLCPELLPLAASTLKSVPENIPTECLLSRQEIAGIFKLIGWESAHMQLADAAPPVRNFGKDPIGAAAADLGGVILDIESPSASPQTVKRSPSTDISFKTFKNILSESIESRRDAKRERWNEMAAFYRTATFAEMMERQESVRQKRTPGVPIFEFEQKHRLEPFEPSLSPEQLGSYAIKFPELLMS